MVSLARPTRSRRAVTRKLLTRPPRIEPCTNKFRAKQKPGFQTRHGLPRRAGKQPWLAWFCAAPMPLIGVALGIYLSMAAFDRHVEAELAKSPGLEICGNPGMGFLFFGFVAGSLGGIIAGVAVANLVTRLRADAPPRPPLKRSARPTTSSRTGRNIKSCWPKSIWSSK